jgi:hypothetical protein
VEKSAGFRLASPSAARMQAASRLGSRVVFEIGADRAGALKATLRLTMATVKRNRPILLEQGRLMLLGTRISGVYRLNRIKQNTLYKSFKGTKSA